MNPVDLIVLCLVALVVFFAIRSMVKTRKAGGCSGCPSCSGCARCSSKARTQSRKA